MSRRIDLTGKRFGRLVVVERAENDKKGGARWRCRCDCGGEKTTNAYCLMGGHVKSCGCLRNKGKHGMSRTRIYNIWAGIRKRCKDKNNPSYKKYGERGVRVCEEWDNSFEAFVGWALNNGYREDLSIDRIDTNGNYEPENCRWATPTTRSRNQRPRENKTGFTGVRKFKNRYAAKIRMGDGVTRYLGNFKTAAEAGAAYQRAKAERDREQG